MKRRVMRDTVRLDIAIHDKISTRKAKLARTKVMTNHSNRVLFSRVKIEGGRLIQIADVMYSKLIKPYILG